LRDALGGGFSHDRAGKKSKRLHPKPLPPTR
jgi:hypothetical protein